MSDSISKMLGADPVTRLRRAQAGTVLAGALAAAALGGAACAGSAAPAYDLGARFDCLRQQNMAVVSAHRGQPDPSAVDNALSSLEASVAAGIPFLEVDVATTRDGVLVLMHDDTLDRTTTGSGPVLERTWAEIRALRLTRPDGHVLDERVPRFVDVLNWGRKAGVLFQIDVKKTTTWRSVVDALRAAGMEQRALIITESVEDAKTVHRLAPAVMISVTIEKAEDLEAVRSAIPADRLLGWTGTRQPAASLLRALRDAGIEPILGTLGRPGDRLDDAYVADGSPSEYAALVASGVVMIASDRAATAQQAIGDRYKGCLGR